MLTKNINFKNFPYKKKNNTINILNDIKKSYSLGKEKLLLSFSEKETLQKSSTTDFSSNTRNSTPWELPAVGVRRALSIRSRMRPSGSLQSRKERQDLLLSNIVATEFLVELLDQLFEVFSHRPTIRN